MNVHTYTTAGGKDLILKYLDSLPEIEKAEGYKILKLLKDSGMVALEALDTRQLKGKVWEIRFCSLKQRMMYVAIDGENIYILHACRKQKEKAELLDLKKTYSRAKELSYVIGKKIL